MATPGWTSLTEKPASVGQPRTVSAPIEHQGVRNALRGAFQEKGDKLIPEDMRQLLTRIR
jgi:hypothetical protein